jgi:uncharacterized protein (DUF433 family)
MQTAHHDRIDMRFERITVNPDQMGGIPCIRGLRIPVATVVGMVADGTDGSGVRFDYYGSRGWGFESVRARSV